MNVKRYDPLTGILLGTSSVPLIISGIFGNIAFADIHVDKIQLNSNGIMVSALILYPSDFKDQRPAILTYHGCYNHLFNIFDAVSVIMRSTIQV